MSAAFHKQKIGSFTGLKVLAMLALFWWHAPLQNPDVDLGARMCEILFVISGFLYTYNHWENPLPATHEAAWTYVKRKFIKIWPLHFIAFLIDILSSLLSGNTVVLSENSLLTGILNLSLLQAWGRDSKIYFSFNGATWFLSALFFCYYIAPLVVEIIKRANNHGIFFLLIVSLRISTELFITRLGWNPFTFNMHVSPVIRLMEFAMGCSLVPLYYKLKSKRVSGNGLTVAELISFSLTVFLMIRFNGIWERCFFVLVFCAPTFIFAYDGGVLSKFFFIKPFQWLLYSKNPNFGISDVLHVISLNPDLLEINADVHQKKLGE